MFAPKSSNPKLIPLSHVFSTWWPLAASWLLMSLELPALSAVVARLANPEIGLAAYGGIVFPIALIIEAPIIMLLAASTALSKDWASYQKLHRFMHIAGGLLTGLHIAIAFTPLYDPVVRDLIGAPAEIIEPARIGLQIMTPWTWAIAYRRFNQGVLIRFGHSRAVTIGTMIRLAGNGAVLALGYLAQDIAGIVVATSAVAVGVVSEAIYIGIRIRPVTKSELRVAEAVQPALTWSAFARFYIPLALTSLITLIVQPLGSAALSRMPDALASLAVWPVISGLIFILRSMGIAFNEVVVAVLDQPLASYNLRRFTFLLASGTSLILFLIAATPLASIWFERISALSPQLTELAKTALWFALPLPALNTLQSWYQGAILNSRETRGIPEAVIAFLVVIAVMLQIGIALDRYTGLYVGLAAFSTGSLAQTIWLWWRSRPAMRAIAAQEQQAIQAGAKL